MRIALIEDDPDQSGLVSLWLQQADHHISVFANGESFLRALRRDSFDLYIVDWMLPDISGIEVVTQLRQHLHDSTPILVATAKSEEHHIVKALESGADDYLVKPLRQGELIARIAAARRRAKGGRISEVLDDAHPYRIDPENSRIYLDEELLALTEKEFELALFFFRNRNQALSRSHLLTSIWGIDNANVTTRTVDTHVSRLRKKLKFDGNDGWKLSSIYQHGYRLESPAATTEPG